MSTKWLSSPGMVFSSIHLSDSRYNLGNSSLFISSCKNFVQFLLDYSRIPHWIFLSLFNDWWDFCPISTWLFQYSPPHGYIYQSNWKNVLPLPFKVYWQFYIVILFSLQNLFKSNIQFKNVLFVKVFSQSSFSLLLRFKKEFIN